MHVHAHTCTPFRRCCHAWFAISFERLSNLLPPANPNSILTKHASNVKFLNDMNTAQVSIWAIVFGLALVITLVENICGYSIPRMLRLTMLHRTRYDYLRQNREPITLENMCAFGMSEDLVRQGAYHFRSIASVFTIPVTLAVFNEHYRWVLAKDGCYTDIGYPHQETLNGFYYIEALGFYLLLYVSGLLVVLLAVCYCCRKHLYQLLRVCLLIFMFTIFTVHFLAVFFLFTNVLNVSDKTDTIHTIFAFVCLLTLLEVEWTLLSPCLCIVSHHKRQISILNRYQTDGRNITASQAADCRMVAFLRGLHVPSGVRSRKNTTNTNENADSKQQKQKQQQQQQQQQQRRRRRRPVIGWLCGDDGGGAGGGAAGDGRRGDDIEEACGATEMKTVIIHSHAGHLAEPPVTGTVAAAAPAAAVAAADDWEHPLQAVALNPLFDPSVFKTVHEFQSARVRSTASRGTASGGNHQDDDEDNNNNDPDGDGDGDDDAHAEEEEDGDPYGLDALETFHVSIEDYLQYRFWVASSPRERAKISRIRAKVKRGRWTTREEERPTEHMAPVLV